MRKMKDSGIEWIGEIPLEWTCCKQKYLIRLVNGRAYSDFEFETDGKYRILRVGNLYTNPVWYTSNLELAPEKYCDDGDLLYSWSMSYGPIIWHGEKVIYHYHIWKVILNADLCKKFAFYYLSSLTSALMAEKHETTMSFITMGVMNNSYIAVPPLPEQHRIAAFLDTRCAAIDALTADIQTQIETLEQYKRSVITEAVTKGLNPDTEMKDSGIEWIGMIPIKWKISRLKFALKEPMKYGATETGVEYEESLYRYIRITDIDANGKLKHEEKLSLTPERAMGYDLKDKAILFARSGATVGKTFMYRESYGKAAFAGYLISAYTNPNIMLPEMLFYYTQSTAYWTWANSIFSQATIQNIGADKYSNMVVLIPPIEEQKKIVDYLIITCSEIEKVIEQKREQIATIEEYKKSLIFEYVTGKKEMYSD